MPIWPATADPPHTLLDDPLLTPELMDHISQMYGHLQSTLGSGAGGGGGARLDPGSGPGPAPGAPPPRPDQPGRLFVVKQLNIMDPLLPSNNLGRSVAKASFARIKKAFAYGAKALANIMDKVRGGPRMGGCRGKPA